MIVETHVCLCYDVQSFVYKPGSGVARSCDTLTFSFHIDPHCGCTSEHLYQQVFMRLEGKAFKKSDVEDDRTLVMWKAKENPGGYQWGEGTGGDENEKVDQLKLITHKNVIRKPIVYMLIKK